MSHDFPTRVSFARAREIVQAVALSHPMPIERQPLSRALGRVLAQDVVAEVALPGFDNAAMDGIAVRSADGDAPRRLVGEQFAGVAVGLALAAGECLRITTGAAMPHGADAVVMKENLRVEGGTILPLQSAQPGQHVRYRGEDVAVGDTVLRAGSVLEASQLSLAAALGHHDLAVRRRPTVAVFTTGDELRAPGQALAPGEIYDSNRVLLQTLLIAEGFEPVAWPVLPDDPGLMAAALKDAAFSFDLVLSCGGVSAGEKDYLPSLLEREGQVHFWKVQMRPGMPVLFGRLGEAHFLGLPGNPVSVLATFLTLARPLLDTLQGRAKARPQLRARLTADVTKTHERLEFLRGVLGCDESGQLLVTPNPADGSHRLRAAALSNALVVLGEGSGQWAAGTLMDVLPYAGLEASR